MKTTTTAIAAILLLGSVAPFAFAEQVPEWVKNNAGWWADGTISESEFLQAIEFLINEGIIDVPPTQVSSEKSQGVPEWVKNNAGWWANGDIDNDSFLQGIQYMVRTGLISVSSGTEESTDASSDNTELSKLEAKLAECQNIKKAYERLDCERAVKHEIKVSEIKSKSEVYNIGPAMFYFPGAEVEITASGNAHLNIDMLVENTSNENLQLMCSGPSVCNYDVWNGNKAFKYASTDFTSGLLVIKPGESRTFNIFFGPNIGYGGTEFIYDPSKEYVFRVSEPWGSASIPLNLS
ncbi:MAG: peptidase [Nitrosopumilaceae archaeon]|nr:peptidase [Nitrosopumilaceae archaeon]NIP09945.1 peptidase [Nitrosopumilaceae archaeon]NIS94716.1 peptidase [Nitrosopumilaceae archaeon]